MGDDADSDASPQQEVTLPAFKIGRHPVTNAQYRRFVEATGQKWLSDDGRQPERANCPAVRISWHEARAYCAWLTEVWRAEGVIADDEVVRLPSEAEWEKVARGSDGRPWPWGDGWDETRCNTDELGLGDTCAVGMFPQGASPYGCLDMAGQVWEWTASLWGKGWSKLEFKYPYEPADGRENLAAGDEVRRVLRGGSFYYYRDSARCAYRYRGSPNRRLRNRGFRVVVSPISPPSAL
jgi:iron(II)-dependent oxidoreductase